MNRRRFLRTGTASLALAGLDAASSRGQPMPRKPCKAPFRLLYGNDLTNLLSCNSPFHRRGEPFTADKLRASIDEAVGADVQLLQPGLTYVPLWSSKLYPPREHFHWWRETFPGTPLHELGDYMLQGGDVVRVFVERCRARGVAPFISLRVNDYHRLEFLDAPAGTPLGAFDSLTLDRFRREHPDYRLRPVNYPPVEAGGMTSKQLFAARHDAVLNWAIPAVRERFLGFVSEIVRDYDIAGLELDFLRHFNLFRLDQTTSAERATIVTELIRRVRRELDAAAGSVRRWLSVRIPAALAVHDPLGLDVASLASAGVDMFNLSSNYFTVQQDLDVAEIRRRAPLAALYVEMTHCTMVGADLTRGHGDNFSYRRATAAQYHTTAELQRARGADGVSFFNFTYFREYGREPERGPFGEPPFDALPQLAARTFPAGMPRHYFLAPAWRSPYRNRVQLPLKVADAGQASVRFDLARPSAGWRTRGWLRLQTETPIPAARWQAKLNGTVLEPVASAAVPRDPHPALQGTAETLATWAVPRELVRDKINEVTLSLSAGAAATLLFVELLFL